MPVASYTVYQIYSELKNSLSELTGVTVVDGSILRSEIAGTIVGIEIGDSEFIHQGALPIQIVTFIVDGAYDNAYNDFEGYCEFEKKVIDKLNEEFVQNIDNELKYEIVKIERYYSLTSNIKVFRVFLEVKFYHNFREK